MSARPVGVNPTACRHRARRVVLSSCSLGEERGSQCAGGDQGRQTGKPYRQQPCWWCGRPVVAWAASNRGRWHGGVSSNKAAGGCQPLKACRRRYEVAREIRLTQANPVPTIEGPFIAIKPLPPPSAPLRAVATWPFAVRSRSPPRRQRLADCQQVRPEHVAGRSGRFILRRPSAVRRAQASHRRGKARHRAGEERRGLRLEDQPTPPQLEGCFDLSQHWRAGQGGLSSAEASNP